MDLSNGFTKELDIFERKKYGEMLTSILSSKDPLIIALDAKWGMGKTTFVKMWQGHLEQKGYHSIYFDAFANDYIENPFTAIAGEIAKLTEKYKQSDFIERAHRVEKTILSGSKYMIFEFARKFLIDAEAVISKTQKEMEINNTIIDVISEKAALDESIKEFRDYLSSLPAKMLDSRDKEAENSQNNANPLIVIIDELDRCKPTFALQVIETVKHFFSVPNVHFVIVFNSKQMESIVKCQYGADIDAAKYLQKFYSILYSIPEDRHNIMNYMRYFWDIQKMSIDNHYGKKIQKFFYQFFENNPDIDFRTVERMVMHVKYAPNISALSDDAEIEYLVLLLLLKYHRPKAFVTMINHNIIYKKDLDGFNSSPAIIFTDSIQRRGYDKDINEVNKKYISNIVNTITHK